ncbi:MAG: carbohydrate ABC transporter permease [Eubacteriales bacterium]|nr:carbohydrate ABC transporter permease [Eubacteriales bacterium]
MTQQYPPRSGTGRPATHVHKRKLRLGRALSVVFLTAVAVLILLPIVFTFLYSFFPKGEMEAYLGLRGNYDDTQWMDFLLSPKLASVRQYYKILIEEPLYLQLFTNSVQYTAAILLGQAVVVPLMAYALSRFEFKGRDALFFAILMLMVLPFQVTMVPSVLSLRFMGILQTPWAVILPMWFSPFYIFLIRQFMAGLPGELLEAGMMDGAGALRCYLHVVLPVCRPIIGAAVALSFADCWNMVEQPLVYLANNTANQPLSVMFNQISTSGADVAFAGAALFILPALFVYFYFQEDILLGVTLSELK